MTLSVSSSRQKNCFSQKDCRPFCLMSNSLNIRARSVALLQLLLSLSFISRSVGEEVNARLSWRNAQ